MNSRLSPARRSRASTRNCCPAPTFPSEVRENVIDLAAAAVEQAKALDAGQLIAAEGEIVIPLQDQAVVAAPPSTRSPAPNASPK